MARDINDAILTGIYENDLKLREIISEHLDIDAPWLVEAIADVLAQRTAWPVEGLRVAIEKNLRPIIEQAAADEMERLEDCA